MTITDFQKKIARFISDRDWSQFHNPKDLALSLTLEATEVLEHFQWKDEKEVAVYLRKNKAAVGEELADVLYWVLLLSSNLDIDLEKAFAEKMAQNEKKYPIAKAKGKATKYTKL
jgi:dCTP diphosphatase